MPLGVLTIKQPFPRLQRYWVYGASSLIGYIQTNRHLVDDAVNITDFNFQPFLWYLLHTSIHPYQSCTFRDAFHSNICNTLLNTSIHPCVFLHLEMYPLLIFVPSIYIHLFIYIILTHSEMQSNICTTLFIHLSTHMILIH